MKWSGISETLCLVSYRITYLVASGTTLSAISRLHQLYNAASDWLLQSLLQPFQLLALCRLTLVGS